MHTIIIGYEILVELTASPTLQYNKRTAPLFLAVAGRNSHSSPAVGPQSVPFSRLSTPHLPPGTEYLKDVYREGYCRQVHIVITNNAIIDIELDAVT